MKKASNKSCKGLNDKHFLAEEFFYRNIARGAICQSIQEGTASRNSEIA